MNPNPKPDPYPNQTLTLALTLTLVAEKWHFPNNGLWLTVLDHMTQILTYDWLVTNYSKWCHRWRHTWRKSRSLISCTQSILVTWPGSGLWLVDGHVNIMTTSVTGLWLANRYTNGIATANGIATVNGIATANGIATKARKIQSRYSRVVVTCRIIAHSFECVIIFVYKTIHNFWNNWI